jgi:hypothetical protein
MRVCTLVLLTIVLAAGTGHAQKDSKLGTSIELTRPLSKLESGIELFLQNRISDALPDLQEAIVDEPRNPDAYAWLAEALRRSNNPQEAHDMARMALSLQPCHAQAHTTLGDLYNPQYAYWEQAHADSTWTHLLKAVECDPGEGVAWFGLWIEGMHNGASEIEGRALGSLATNGFITPGALAYARWMLGSLPKDAILLTNGDMDTYPLVTLQKSQGFRNDVAVVNASLLNLDWYASLMTARHRITGGYNADEIAMLQEGDTDAEVRNTISRQVIARWIEAQRNGKLKRPLAIGVGVSWTDLVSNVDNFTLAGPYWIHDTGKKHRALDATTLWSSLRGLKASQFTGPFVSNRDRSPIRRAYSPPTAGGAVTGDLWRAVEAMREMGTTEATREAEKLAAWIEKFDAQTGGKK